MLFASHGSCRSHASFTAAWTLCRSLSRPSLFPRSSARGRSSLDPIVPGPCRPLVLLLNGLCFVAGLLVRLSSSAASARAENGGKAAEAAEATAAAAAAFTLLAASLVTMTLAVVCPEVPRPAGSTSQVRGWGGGSGGRLW